MLGAHLRAALVRLNPDVPPEGITAAIDQLTVDRSAMSLFVPNVDLPLSQRNAQLVLAREYGYAAGKTSPLK